MRQKTTGTKSTWSVMLRATLVGLGLTLALMLLGAGLVLGGKLPMQAIMPCAFAFLSLGCLVAAWLGRAGRQDSSLVHALGAGLAVFVLLFAFGMLSGGGALNLWRSLASLGCALAASLAGGAMGANLHRRKSSRHFK